MEFDVDKLQLTEIIQLQNQLTESLKRRFEKPLALGFTDVVGSTAYFARFGDQSGRGLQQRHFDLLNEVLPGVGGRIVDTAGDGAFTAFPTAEGAATAMCKLQERISILNASFAREHQLSLRVGIHWGSVLTDGKVVTGDSVNLCARVASTSNPSEIRVTRAAFQELNKEQRLRCRGLPPAVLKGITDPVELMSLAWREESRFASKIRIRESGEVIPLPPLDTITFGRLREQNGIAANDIVLTLTDPQLAQQVSRWHFELRRKPEGFILRSVTDQVTEVDGQQVFKGAEVPIVTGSAVRLARVMTLEFLGDTSLAAPSADATMYNQK